MSLAASAIGSRRRSPRVQVPAPVVVRCAVYCRKSTNEGLDSDFSSIDNQREACEAFITSQRSEGWTLVKERFEDGGFSGGTIERPALKKLLTLVQQGEIDCVVVYKIDRLSRSLLDFVRLLELFEERGVSFVSVTQQINTTTSAGRLMLNVLMSFAQFEREIGSERTREKMHAARKKGRYIGGHSPLGYDIDRVNHRLVVNPQEAEIVRELFNLYLDLRSLMSVVKVVNDRGWRRKSWQTAEGVGHPGSRFEKVYLQRLLTNPVYIGQVTLKDEVYPGQHDAIVDEETFRQVNDLLTANRNCGDASVRNKHGALLRGLLKCGRCGASMAHTWTRKGNRVYRFYGCNRAQKQGRSACSTPTLSAGQIEEAVITEIRKLAQDPQLVDAVFSEVLLQTKQTRKRLDSERTRLLRQRQQREEAVQRLVSTIEGMNGDSPEDITQRIAERRAEVTQISQRLAEIDSELQPHGGQAVDRDHLAKTLAHFTQLWDVLYPQERVKLVHSLIESVVYNDEAGGIDIRLRTTAGSTS